MAAGTGDRARSGGPHKEWKQVGARIVWTETRKLRPKGVGLLDLAPGPQPRVLCSLLPTGLSLVPLLSPLPRSSHHPAPSSRPT